MERWMLDQDYLDFVQANEGFCYKDYLETIKKVQNSTAMYKGEPIPFLYMPKFYTQQDIKNFKNLIHTLMGILNKVITYYIEKPVFREKFGFSKALEELIITEHGYVTNIPMGRFDIFYGQDGSFKFCELNADGSSAMNEDRELSQILSETIAVENFKEKYTLQPFELFDTWVDECKNIYKEFGGEKSNPSVAIVDYFENGVSSEFDIFKNRFEKQGFKTVIADARELTYQDGKLYAGDVVIDIVYRRLVTRDLMEKYHELPDFVEACRDGNVCMIGPIKSQIIHNKIIFKVLHDADTLALLTEDEQRFIKDHIPYTTKFEGEDLDFNTFIENKDQYILKPMDLYASRGVYAGRDYTEEEWEAKLEACHGKDYLIQAYCVPPKTNLVEYVDGKMKVTAFNNITGLYVYNEKFCGVYSRVGKNPIISGLHECYTLPTFFVQDKSKK